jgi:DNA repair protein RecN (Recombination protein N)
MLRELDITDYAIIDELRVRFAPGLNTLSGETGAGKSIIVGALSFTLGERVSDDVIRKGGTSCRVEARFEAGAKLSLRQLHPELVGEGASCITLCREINRDGRSRCTINGKPVTLTALREIGDQLVDFHGQHEHQTILNVASHIDFLDDFGGLHALRDKVASSRKALGDAGKRIAALSKLIEDVVTKQDFIRHEIGEIESLGLKDDEDVHLDEEISLLENAEKIIQAGSGATEVLYDGDEAAIKLVSRARQLVEKIAPYSRDLVSMAESLDQAQVIIKETAESLRDCLARIDLDASRLEYLRERAAAIERIKRKFGKSVDEVLTHLKELKASLENREELEAEVARLEKQREAMAAELLRLASDLSAKRKAQASRLEKLVEKELESLGMQGGGFKVVFEAIENGDLVQAGAGDCLVVGEKGADDVEFFIRTNKGEDLLPLRRIASGGEISRVMLALKRILAEVDRVGTLVFDEIDVGIGGSTADVVAGKLREVAGSRQVICITHLPQIAAAAELHLAVGKGTARGRTITKVAEVRGEDRVRELARMLAGSKAPKTALVHAEEMLKRSGSSSR